MSHPDPLYDADNSNEDDVVYDDYNDFYREDEIEEDNVWDDSYDDSMDGDFDSAMRDAGYGVDEDYGYYGENY
jgi:hypothetical protein